ncbi:hypothetical protein GCM10010869_19970 [Mesorhizobium tianshanense]|uniref:Uncharacterized protein n=1 Tax=Mesorhizobium tianshanense TaxID=39844 RepID=A0A562MFP9_9HYPH|nr:hypothetical protein [Mesorhizobium tianshanense]TWI18724.1 hypothetical protein IQ26_07254 [Mesorhizobium tianshanense]GLS36408.1 hypothetical protein GCM10010869_19970 [Mesorhizobium tianshanense]
MIGAIKGLAGVLLAAAMLYGMQRTTPLYSDIISPVPVAGRQGERVDTSAFAIGVADVHLAREVMASSFGRTRTYTTSGVWVIIEAAAAAKQESLSLTSAKWLGPNGVRHALSQRFSAMSGMLGSERLEPGIPRPMLMAFEVPESQLSGATLLIARSALTPLAEEAWIEMTDVRAQDIRPAVTLGRGNRSQPWTLEAE